MGKFCDNLLFLCLFSFLLSDEVVLLKIVAHCRPDIVVLLEQPFSSWMFKQIGMQEVIQLLQLRKISTYLGLYGHDLQKGTHLYTSLRIVEMNDAF